MKTLSLSLSLLALASLTPASAATIYDNTTTDTLVTYFYSANGVSQIGDQLALGGTDRLLNSATVQFYNGALTSGTFTAILRFFEVGGPVGAQLGGDFVLNNALADANTVFNLTFTGLNLNVPDNVIFTVAISNVTAGLDLGLNAFEPPTTGSSNNSQLIINNGSFSTGTTASGEGNLYLALDASASPVPEPSSLALLGGAAILGYWRARKARA